MEARGRQDVRRAVHPRVRVSLSIKSVGIVGAGTMGRGIAQLCAQKGFSVQLFDVVSNILPQAMESIQAALGSAAAKGRLTSQEAQAAQSRIICAKRLEDLAGVDLVVEAVSEDLALKRKLFTRLDALVKQGAVLATNTSSLSVRAIASAARHPGCVVGLHFFNPPVAMKLVEVIRSPETDDACVQKTVHFAQALGKTAVLAQDFPGFIVNRVVRPFYLEALRMAGEGWGDYQFIDSALRDTGKFPMGPFELMDLIGVDVNLTITKTIYAGLGRPQRLRPHPIQERLVRAGCHGRKTQKGFYLYSRAERGDMNPEAVRLLPKRRISSDPPAILERAMSAIADEAQRAFNEKVASRADIDAATTMAMNFPIGPFAWRQEHAAKTP